MPIAVSLVYLIWAWNGTAGNVELKVDIGHELTGHGITSEPRLPPQHGVSAQAYRTPVIWKCAVQFSHQRPASASGGGHGFGKPSRPTPCPQPIGIAVGAIPTTLDQPRTARQRNPVRAVQAVTGASSLP
jgi:hypothetical protein